jgi:SAM-dependent methyltransferase
MKEPDLSAPTRSSEQPGHQDVPTTQYADGAVRVTTSFPSADEMSEYLGIARRDRLLLNRLDRWLLNELKPALNSRVLEVGCGHGNIVPFLLDRELVVATDQNSEAVAEVCDRFRDHANLQTCVFDVTASPPVEIFPYKVNTVISLNLLEHIEDDLKAVRNMVRLMPEGGTLVIIVPAHNWLYGPMDSSIGHFRRYTKSIMHKVITLAGAEVSHQSYRNMFGALGWWFAGRVLRRKNPPAVQLSLFNRLVPLFAFVERIVRPPFGLSLITIAKVSP